MGADEASGCDLPDEPTKPPITFTAHVRSAKQYHRDAAARRRDALRLRTPNWAEPSKTTSVYAQAERLTRETGVQHHVDHDIPLRSELVSGLHIHTNLVVRTARDNLSKGSKFEVL